MTFPLILILAAVLFFLFGWFVNTFFGNRSLKDSKSKATDIIENARAESENLKKEKLLEANEEYYNLKQKLEDEFRQKKQSLQQQEKLLNERETNIDRKADFISKREAELEGVEKDFRQQEEQLQVKHKRLNSLMDEHNAMLEKVAGLSSDEARKILMDNLVESAKQNAAKIINNIEEEARREANKRAQSIVISSIQQSGINMAIESTVAVVALPSDDMKGRIIGREGRNIRAFEIVTGIDVIVDDTPGSIILSGFDPLRREIARIVMEKLVADGRIHPGRIEDMYEKVKTEMNDYLQELGEQAVLECGVHGIAPELTYMLGKLRYRTSFGQNVLQHSKEVSIISGIMAAELGLDVHLAQRAGLLHDIGRALDQQTDGDHAQTGAELARKYNENPTVQNAIAAHTGKAEHSSPISVLVQTANEISKSRPGARREAVQSFISRLQQMESICLGFEGVQLAYAIQAGKEVRVIVSHERVDDVMLNQLAQDIAKKIEDEVEYPGHVKVVVIREYRSVEYA
jgi:ribonuclease Y